MMASHVVLLDDSFRGFDRSDRAPLRILEDESDLFATRQWIAFPGEKDSVTQFLP